MLAVLLEIRYRVTGEEVGVDGLGGGLPRRRFGAVLAELGGAALGGLGPGRSRGSRNRPPRFRVAPTRKSDRRRLLTVVLSFDRAEVDEGPLSSDRGQRIFLPTAPLARPASSRATGTRNGEQET